MNKDIHVFERVAIVTGGAEGIGAAIAKTLSNAGFKVAVLDICKELLWKTVGEIRQQGKAVHGVVCDVTNKEQVFDAVEQVKSHFGHIDVLVANAGVCHASFISRLHVEKWINEVDVNIKGTLHCVAASIPGMIERKRGHVVFISSITGRMGIPQMTVYSGTKHFIQGFAAAMRQELAPMGIKVTCIKPGMVKTRLSGGKDSDNEVVENFKKSQKYSSAFLAPDEVSKAVEYSLLQEDNVGVNEITLEISQLPISCV